MYVVHNDFVVRIILILLSSILLHILLVIYFVGIYSNSVTRRHPTTIGFLLVSFLIFFFSTITLFHSNNLNGVIPSFDGSISEDHRGLHL